MPLAHGGRQGHSTGRGARGARVLDHVGHLPSILFVRLTSAAINFPEGRGEGKKRVSTHGNSSGALCFEKWDAGGIFRELALQAGLWVVL